MAPMVPATSRPAAATATVGRTGPISPAPFYRAAPAWRRRGCVAQAQSGGRGMSVSDMSSQMKDVRSQMEQDENLRVLMQGFRGKNLSEADFASADVKMNLIEVDSSDSDQLPQVYAPESIEAYWGRRPVSLVRRVLQLLGISGSFLGKLALDAVTGKLKAHEVDRAIELRNIVTSLGPAYIKLGQALAIRPDLLSPAAMNELQKLCDKVPSFDTAVAMRVVRDELGRPWQDIYSELTPEPVAAASLGQVYKGVLKSSGEVVAVKVQRPYVLETVTIDLYLIRRLGLFLRRFPQLRTDVVALLDEWAERFFEELDYVKEGANATRFAASIADYLPQVVVPRTYAQYTSRRVLTTQWLEGEKLSQSKADDVLSLVNVGVLAYLFQLLDTGFFHADPHPGNLIRTPDGRLAILDFGLMTQVDDNIKVGMVEAIAHLIHRDYEAIVKDFVTLDFIPEGTDLQPILPVLARVFERALAGGGAKNINFNELAADLAEITYNYPFRIPPYFALIIRAIGVLEGIALVADPEFAIIDQSYPFLSKLLLTDRSPRLRAALQYMIYGKGKVFDADRLIDLLQAFETFASNSKTARGNMDAAASPSQGRLVANTTYTPTMPAGGSFPLGFPFPLPLPFPLPPPVARLPAPAAAFLPPGSSANPLEAVFGMAAAAVTAGTSLALPSPFATPASAAVTTAGAPSSSGAREALRFVLSPEGEFFREFVMDELVKSIDALSREQLFVLASQLGVQGAQVPVLLPGAKRASVPLAPQLSDEDRQVVDNVAKLLNFFLRGSSQQRGGGGLLAAAPNAEVIGELLPLLPTVANQVLPQLAQRLASRVGARVLRELYLE